MKGSQLKKEGRSDKQEGWVEEWFKGKAVFWGVSDRKDKK